VESGQEVDLAVDMQAPASPGHYRAYYNLCTPNGIRFGQAMWVDIVVVEDDIIQEEKECEREEKKETTMEVEYIMSEKEGENLQRLHEMGFTEKDTNLTILRNNSGDLSSTVKDLLNSS